MVPGGTGTAQCDLGTQFSLALGDTGREAFLFTSLSPPDEDKEQVLAWC